MAGNFVFRFFRFSRSICAPTTCVILFSLLLTWIFILYQPTPGPGELQRLGWQAWEVVSSSQIPLSSSTSTDKQDGDSNTDTTTHDDDLDWWNVTISDSKADTTSLPLDKWSPLLPHDTGFTEITAVKCILPPSLTYLCTPGTTPEEDAKKGKWVRVDQDINFPAGFFSMYLYYRRTRRLDVSLVSDIVLLPEKEEPTTQGNWTRVSASLREGIYHQPPLYLWYQLGKSMSQMTDEDKQNLIMELDIHRGEDRPWYGFKTMEPPISPIQENRFESVRLSLRRGVHLSPRAPPLHFSHDGHFKILQIADLHYSVSAGSCRDVDFSPCTHSDNLTNSLLAHILDEEKPDMVVFSGDQSNGQETSWDSRSVLAKFAITVTDRGIPWAAVFGNHDSEVGSSREDQIKLMQGLPYSLVEAGPGDIHGVGNYVLKIKSADASKTHLLTLYFLDSGSYSKGFFDWFGFIHYTDYDWIHQDQIDWFLQESATINPIIRPFRPDGSKDFGHIWKRQGIEQVTPESQKLAKPNALMFFHIPLQESYLPADIDTKTDLPLNIGIHDVEESGASKGNDGFFDKGILQAFETDQRTRGTLKEVKVIANGHQHVTENCKRVKGVWLCFGGGGSYSGYGKVGFDRRFRIYDISDYGEVIRTYKRTSKDEILDDMILVGKGSPAPYEGLR